MHRTRITLRLTSHNTRLIGLGSERKENYIMEKTIKIAQFGNTDTCISVYDTTIPDTYIVNFNELREETYVSWLSVLRAILNETTHTNDNSMQLEYVIESE